MSALYALLVLSYLSQAEMPAAQYATIEIKTDFVQAFDGAVLENAPTTSASRRESIENEVMAGIFLHPGPQGESKVRYDGIFIPAGPPVFLHAVPGIREGVPWDGPKHPNGVRFSAYVDDGLVFRTDVVRSEWRPLAADLSPWAGKTVSITLATEAINGDTNYDWAVWGGPVLAAMVPAVDALTEKNSGVAMLRVESPVPGEVALSMGSAKRVFPVGAGECWLPLAFGRMLPLKMDAAPEGARSTSLWVAAHTPRLVFGGATPTSPLALAGRPFGIRVPVKNGGLGYYTGADRVGVSAIRLPRAKGDEPEMLSGGPFADAIIPDLAPGEKAVLSWDGITADRMGDILIDIDASGRSLEGMPLQHTLHVFPPEPKEYTGIVREEPDGTRFAGVMRKDTGKMRVKAAEDMDRQTYLIAEVMRGGEFRRAGVIYPLAEGMLRTADGQMKKASLKIQDGDISENFAEARGEILGQPVLIRLTPDWQNNRIHALCTLQAVEPLELAAFHGPAMLAGEGAWGAAKDFALFGGLEYLEGPEASSSERDLAWPLNERRVPALHKIASPVMAVQGGGMLMALLWNPHQDWAAGKQFPAAWFDAPKPGDGGEHARMSLFAPSVGDHVGENTFAAEIPHKMNAGEKITLEFWLVLDSVDNHDEGGIVRGPHKGGLVLEAYRHYFDLFGMPEPSPQPRPWEEELALCLKGYDSVWSEDPPGWAHCVGWNSGNHTAHIVPQLLALVQTQEPSINQTVPHRTARVLERAMAEQGPQYLWSSAGAHILLGELPFLRGFTATALENLRDTAQKRLGGREEGYWRWHPAGKQHEKLGVPGDHTLGQQAQPLFVILRAARLSGDDALAAEALEALKNMDGYEVPRGSQTWECPLYQPDILAAAQAVRAYTEAYRLTGDGNYLAHARYWAMTGLPFLYLWDMDGYPTMRYNVISVMGSTFFTHSWLGLPVVWCGLVYAYALQDLAEFDKSFDWKKIAQGITNSAMWQQYTTGPSTGTYPDSWNMVDNRPNPADINPENILVNELRLRGLSPEIRHCRVQRNSDTVHVNSSADISARWDDAAGQLELGVDPVPGMAVYTAVRPLPRPVEVWGAGPEAADEAQLAGAGTGWFYAEPMRMLVIKSGSAKISVK